MPNPLEPLHRTTLLLQYVCKLAEIDKLILG
jgi:hypothetical protein